MSADEAYVAALEAVERAARAVYENDDFVCEPSDGSRSRDSDLGAALVAVRRVKADREVLGG